MRVHPIQTLLLVLLFWPVALLIAIFKCAMGK